MIVTLIWASAVLAIALLVTVAALRGWRGWLDLRRYEIDAARDEGSADTGVRIELAGLRERMRKLEAIATGVDP